MDAAHAPSLWTVLGWLFQGGIGALLTLATYWLKCLRQDLASINAELGKHEARVGRLEEWRTQREKLTDERHEAQQDQNRELWDAIQALRDGFASCPEHARRRRGNGE